MTVLVSFIRAMVAADRTKTYIFIIDDEGTIKYENGVWTLDGEALSQEVINEYELDGAIVEDSEP